MSQLPAAMVCRRLLIHIEKISHLLQLEQGSYGLSIQSGHMATYRSGIGHFEPHFCKYSKIHQDIAAAYCKASRDVMAFEASNMPCLKTAQCLLLISADLLYHSPSRIDISGGVSRMRPQEISLKELLQEVHGQMKSSRIRRQALSLRWLLHANDCIGAPMEGFEAPTEVDREQRTAEVVANLLHEDTFSAFMFDVNRILRTSKTFQHLAAAGL
eukprot:scaffold33392_cov55-Prasinocladus_malaysianus.AAC.1